jgi:hypothetical protein
MVMVIVEATPWRKSSAAGDHLEARVSSFGRTLRYGLNANAQNHLSFFTTLADVKPAATSNSAKPAFRCPE